MKYVPVGRIVSCHGIKGETRFRYYNEEKEVLYGYTSFFIHENDRWKRLETAGIHFRKGSFSIRFKGLERPEDVAFLINKELFVREEDLPELEENEYYEYQLKGLTVFNEANEALGKVAEIIHTGANDVMLVKGDREILVPMIEDCIVEINIEEASIRIKGEGLFV